MYILYPILAFSLIAQTPETEVLSEENNRAKVCEQEAAGKINKLHILYLLQSQELGKSIDLYRAYKEQLGRHDFEILQHIASIILEQGIRSQEPDMQLTSLFGSKIAGVVAPIDALEIAITRPYQQMQLA